MFHKLPQPFNEVATTILCDCTTVQTDNLGGSTIVMTHQCF